MDSPKDGEAGRRERKDKGHEGVDGASWTQRQLLAGKLTLSILLLGVVGKGQALHEGHQAVLVHEGPVPSVQPQLVLHVELGPAFLAGKGLLFKVFCQLVVLHPCGGRQGTA